MHSTNHDSYDIIISSLQTEWAKNMNKIPQPKWAKPEYSGNQIKKAGQTITSADKNSQEYKDAIAILNNWRAAHAYPLHVITMNLRNKNSSYIVAQRLKRLDSIVGKLERNPNMNLYRMQDLGGCRVICDTLEEMYEIANSFKHSRIRHIFKRETDYIQNPKTSGYRCLHMVYQFHSDTTETYNQNMLIEIQFRTRLQHIWATAIEMMGIYTKTNLKASQGNEDYLRFFLLTSSIFAIRENTPLCPNTPTAMSDIIAEMQELNDKHNIIKMLMAINTTVKYNDTENSKSGYYLLRLNITDNILNINYYKNSEILLAMQTYNEIEKMNDPNIDTVLVSTKSLSALQDAYPNYFVDISKFINIIQQYIK